jgi:hypothetical protein
MKNIIDDIKEAFLARKWNSFHLLGKKLAFVHLKDFYQICMWIALEATMDSTTMQDHCCLPHFKL